MIKARLLGLSEKKSVCLKIFKGKRKKQGQW